MKDLFQHFMMLSVLVGTGIWFLPDANARSRPQKESCNRLEIDQKNCHLHVGQIKVALSSEKIRFHDPLWLGVELLPLTGVDVNWHKVKLNEKWGRRWVEFQAWGPSEGETGWKKLNWYFLELIENKIQLQATAILQRKQLRGPASKPLFDPLTHVYLDFKRGRIHWRAGQQMGEF